MKCADDHLQGVTKARVTSAVEATQHRLPVVTYYDAADGFGVLHFVAFSDASEQGCCVVTLMRYDSLTQESMEQRVRRG